ncbi:MAG: hypothetical protein JST92_26970 [Deltaproteobacteria bacterium]|nr:hypothetical protein [Deltaproteobacteria bacterium]
MRSIFVRSLIVSCLLAAPSFAADNKLALPDTSPPAPPLQVAQTTDTSTFKSGMKTLSFFAPSGGGAGLSGGIFLTNTTALRMDIAMNWVLTGNTDFAFDVGLGYRMYLVQAGRLFGFIEPGVDFGREQTISHIGVNFGIGAEYFLLDRFSIAAKTALGLNVGNLGGNGSATAAIGTGTSAVYLNFHFP